MLHLKILTASGGDCYIKHDFTLADGTQVVSAATAAATASVILRTGALSVLLVIAAPHVAITQ